VYLPIGRPELVEGPLGIALEMKNVCKRYPGTLAVDSIALCVNAGEVHAPIGENGAGKSLLTKGGWSL